MNFVIGLLILLQMKMCQSLHSANMNLQYQRETYELIIEDLDFISRPGYSIFYGIWSQYTPLSQVVAQVGQTGLFNSSCFHLHTATDKETNNINFIYYDCLDNEHQIITKNIQFRDDQNVEHTIVINIDNNLYESIWYYFSITIWPQINRCIIIFRESKIYLLNQELQIRYPYFDRRLLLTFGGGGISFDGSTKYSYFPGIMYLAPIEKLIRSPDYDDEYLLFDICSCQLNQQPNIIDNQYFKINEKLIFRSQYANCDYFQFGGWIKITEIISEESDFNFKLLKITTNSQIIKLTDDNLSPFCLTYRISNTQNQILITTYSFTYPTVNVDMLPNQFLIPIEFNIDKITQLWHFVSVILSNNQLQINIAFYEGVQQFLFSRTLEVNQFHIVEFQVQIGNLNGRMDNYLNFQTNQVKLFNCDSDFVIQACHSDCETCDGPTSTDCLTCKLNSYRTYLQTTKQCICPLDSIDQGQCLKIKDLSLNAISTFEDRLRCIFGYFEINQSCYKCPQSQSNQQINCIECLTNPKTWSNMLYCSQSKVSINGNSYGSISDSISYYTFDEFIGIDLCDSCTSNCTSDQCKEERYLEKQQETPSLCSSVSNNICYKCQIENCLVCIMDASKLVCVICESLTTELVDGNCIYPSSGCIENCANCYYYECQSCYLPYYLSSDRTLCKSCPIKNCKYCFEFLMNDFSQSTLYQQFSPFYRNEYWKVGCAQCNEGFNYDFTIEKCVFGGIGISNCLRSYIDLSGKEICLLSAVDDFDIAPEIINCELHIPNCRQCLLTPSQKVQCLICVDGYTASTISGLCDSLCSLEYAKYCIEGNLNLDDYWVEYIQSFLMQFLEGYFYPISYDFLHPFPVCIPGYRITSVGQCEKDCDEECLECKEVDQYNGFFCQKCPSTYYDLPNLSEDNGSCLSCPLLCASCQPRTSNEISTLNPYFVSTSANIIYSQKCLRAINNENVELDSETQIASHCFSPGCGKLEYQINKTCDAYGSMKTYDSDLLTIYCNEKGIKTLSFIISSQITSACSAWSMSQATLLKSQVFSMKNIHFSLIGQKEQSQLQNSFFGTYYFTLSNYDQVKLQYIIFNNSLGTDMILENGNQPISFLVLDSVIFTDLNQVTQFRFVVATYKDLLIQNLTLLNLHISNVTLLNYFSKLNEKQIEISELHIHNCLFKNSTLFLFTQYSQAIKISQIDIQNSTFIFSTFIQYFYRATSDEVSSISILINSSIIQHSTFIANMGNQILYISDLQLFNSKVINSIFIETDLSATLIKARISDNQFLSSIFFRAIQQSNQSNSTLYLFSDFQIQKTDISNSTLFIIHQENVEINPVVVQFNNIQVQYLKVDELYKQPYPYDLQIEDLSIHNFSITDSPNISFFQIYQTKVIIISNIRYENHQQLHKILPTQQCNMQTTSHSILLQVQGFFTLQLTNISIINQFSIDNSFIQILSDLLYYPSHNEIIRLANVKYFGNILLKYNRGNILSLLIIFSEKFQNIELKNIEFQENYFNQLVDDPSLTAASLIFINSQQSTVIIQNLSCISNGITNSSNSFIVINSLLQQFNQFQISNSNLMSNDIWLKYYSIVDLNQFENINLLIQQVFRISNSGGVASLQSSSIMISNSFFQNILASSSSGFNIITQGRGNVELVNITIVKVSTLLGQTTLPDGCITIISKNSLLNLKLTNIIFQEVHNRMESTIFTIIPSLKQNSIYFTNLTIIDCFSLINQVISIEFSQDSIKQSQIFIKQLTIISSEIGLAKYLKQITFPSGPEIKKIKSEGSMFNLKGCCSLILDNCYFTGILMSPIFILTDIEMLVLTNILFNNLSVLYPLRIIQFQLTTQISHQLVFRSISFQSISELKSANNLYNTLSEQMSISYNYADCRATIILSKSSFENNTLNSLMDSFNQQFQQQGAIAVLNDLSNLSNVHLSQINIFNNNCSFCYEGIFVIKQQSLANIKILESNCYSNSIIQFGCFYFLTNFLTSNNLLNQLTIKDSVYISNNGTKGVGIFSQNTLFKIIRCKFFFNNASEEGGAIFTQNLQQNFSLSNTQIVQNYANIGGGIYFGGKNHLSPENSIQCVVVFNKANLYSDNLFEAPDHLVLKINNMEMKSEILHQANTSIDTLSLLPYNQIEQGKPIITTQVISKFQVIKDLIQKNSCLNPILHNFHFNIKIHYRKLQLEMQQINALFRIENIMKAHLQQLKSYPIYFQQGLILVAMSLDLKILLSALILILLMMLSYNFILVANHKINQIIQLIKLTQDPLNASWESFMQMMVAKFANQLLDFILQFMMLQPAQYLIIQNLTISPQIKFNSKMDFGGQTINQICQRNVLKIQIGVLEDGMSIIISVIKVILEDYVKNVIFITFEEMVNISKLIILYAVFAIMDGQQQYLLSLQPYGNYQEYFRSIISILLTLNSIRNTNQIFCISKLRTKLFEIVFKLSLNFEGIFLKMLLNYLWIFSVIFTFNITFDFSFGFVDQASNPSFSMATTLDCQLSEISDGQLIYIRSITIIIFILLQIMLIFVGFKFYSMLFKQRYEINTISNTIIYLFVSNQAALVKNFGSLIASRTISGLDYIQGDVSLFFYDENHIKWIFIFILPGLIIFGVFMPLTFFLILFWNKHRLNQTKFRKHFGYLFNEYQKENDFWEQIKIWKRSIIIIIMTYFETNILAKASLTSLTLVCYQVLALRNKPYSINSLNLLDIQSGQIIQISIFLAVVKYGNEQENNPVISNILSVFILFLCLKLCYDFIFRILRLYIKKYHTVFLYTLYNLASKFMEDGILVQYLKKELAQKKKQREQLHVNIENLRQHVIIIPKKENQFIKQFFLDNFSRRNLSQQSSLSSVKKKKFDLNLYLIRL